MTPLQAVRPANKRPDYRDGGIRLPSVTTIIGVLDAPGLDRWRVKQALNGIDPYADRSAADAGTLAHAAIAWALDPERNEYPDTSGQPETVVAEAVAAFQAWKAWREAHNVEPILIEHVMANKALGYAGTLDFFGRIDGRLEVVDWKTSAEIYPDYFVQSCAYAHLLAATTEHIAAGVRIVLLNKQIQLTTGDVWVPAPGRSPLFAERVIDSDGTPAVSAPHFRVFEAARLAHSQQLEWKRKGGDPSRAPGEGD